MKRHVNELEKQGFVKRIKRFDDSGRQRSNIYQLRLPNDSHIQQADIDLNDQTDLDNANVEQTDLPPASPDNAQKTEHAQKTDHSDTHLGDSRSNTESDHPAHIIFHKEHKTELSLKNGILDDTDVLDPPSGSEQHEISTFTSKPKNEAVIHLLTKEGSAPIYHEFTTILERTYPKLDVLQELHAMQAWLYINQDKRKPFEHIGHFVNGWLRRSAQAKAKHSSSPVFKQTGAAKQGKTVKQIKAVKPSKKSQSIKALGSITAVGASNTDKPTADLHHAHSSQNDQAESKSLEPKQPTPVTQALADYNAKSTTNPFEERVKALIQSRSTSTDNEQ